MVLSCWQIRLAACTCHDASKLFFLVCAVIILSVCVCVCLLPSLVLHPLVTLYIYTEKYFSDDHFSYIVRILTWRAWRCVQLPVAIAKMSWIRVLDTPSCYERAAPSRGRRESPHGFASTRFRIGQNCRVVYIAHKR
jgi:hypothetical protein